MPNHILENISIYYAVFNHSLIVPILIILFRWKNVWTNKEYKYMAIYMFVDVLSAVFSYILAFAGYWNIIVPNVFSVIEFFLVSFYFIEIFNLRKTKQLKIITTILTITLGSTVYFYQNQSYNNISSLILSPYFITLSLLFFAKTMREQKINNLFKYPPFWFNSGILFYFSCSVFINIFSNYSIENMSNDAQKTLWFIHSVLNFISYIIYAIAFLTCKQIKLTQE